MRLLVIDPDAARANNFAAALRTSGFTPDHLDLLGDATEALSSTRYHGMLLQHSLPDGNGVPWLRRCRARGFAIPAVVLMGRSTVDERIEALDAGADDCLQVPVDRRELVARVRALLRRPPILKSPVVQAGDLTLDCQSRELWINDRPLPMPRRELCMLEALMTRLDRIVTREVLENNLYGHADSWCANSIDVRVSRLRRLLGAAGATVSIQTVKGIGYRLQSGGQSR